MKAVVDTNVLVSGMIRTVGYPARVVDAIRVGTLQLIVDDRILAEYADVIKRDYFRRYFIGHYNPAGNHFFAYSIKDRIVEWLDPKPITYKDPSKRMIDFKDYLQDY